MVMRRAAPPPESLGFSLEIFLEKFAHERNLNMSGPHMLVSILSITSILSFIWPDLGLWFSYTFYSLWTAFLLTDYRILQPHPTKVRALHMALFMKIVLALLQTLNNVIQVSAFFGAGWYLVVPGVLCLKPGGQGGETVGKMLLDVARMGLPPAIFPRLIRFDGMRDQGALDRVVRFNLPGLHESILVASYAFGVRVRIEQIWLCAAGMLVVIHQMGYNGLGLAMVFIHAFKMWYSIRVVLHPQADAEYFQICSNVFCFWILAEIATMSGNIPFLGPIMLHYGNISAASAAVGIVAGLTGYARGTNVGYSRTIVGLLFGVN